MSGRTQVEPVISTDVEAVSKPKSSIPSERERYRK